MNQAFKNCIEESDSKENTMNHFETSVIYITKRHSQNYNFETHKKQVEKLIQQTEILKDENKKLKAQIDEINSILENIKDSKSTSNKLNCSIL